eukprot:4511432-Pyramimonas_sp.AAC.1
MIGLVSLKGSGPYGGASFKNPRETQLSEEFLLVYRYLKSTRRRRSRVRKKADPVARAPSGTAPLS